MAYFDRQQIGWRSRLSLYLLIVILAAIWLVLLIKSDHLAVQGLSADATLETSMMKPDITHHEGRMTIYKYRSISLSAMTTFSSDRDNIIGNYLLPAGISLPHIVQGQVETSSW